MLIAVAVVAGGVATLVPLLRGYSVVRRFDIGNTRRIVVSEENVSDVSTRYTYTVIDNQTALVSNATFAHLPYPGMSGDHLACFASADGHIAVVYYSPTIVRSDTIADLMYLEPRALYDFGRHQSYPNDLSLAEARKRIAQVPLSE